jgi:hypothetical protein
LASYLANHPRIFVSDPKEPHFFNTDSEERGTWNLDDYEAIFAEAVAHHEWVMEASTLYLYSEVAVRNIVSFNPDARFIVLLRRPADMVVSWHAQKTFELVEDIENFERAWDAIAARRAGCEIPAHCRDHRRLFYDEIAKYGAQLQRVFAVVPRDRVLVILFDDLARDPRAVYEQVLDFLRLGSDGREFFDVLNERSELRSRRLNRILSNPFILRLKQLLGVKGPTGLLAPLYSINRKRAERKPLSDDYRARVNKTYEEDVRVLERLLDRPLDHWLA